MLTVRAPYCRRAMSALLPLLAVALIISLAAPALAQPAETGGEARLVLPDLTQATFLGTDGRSLLMWGLAICALGLLFGLLTYTQLRRLPVHRSMLEISELIYETCKTYLITQGKFLLILEVFIGVIIAVYFGVLEHMEPVRVVIILLFSLVGIAGSYGVAWFGIRVNTFANSRTAFASLTGKAYPCNSIPLKAGMSIGMMLISIELVIMLFILLFVPRDYAGPCFIGFAIGESLGAAALRVAGGIFTKIADIGADLMKIVFKIKEDDARNPGVIADCTGDNAGDSVGPSADGFETYGVTGVALITFILLAVNTPLVQVQLLVWIFVMRVVMVISSGISYFINGAIATSRYRDVAKMNFEAPLTSLVWLTSLISIAFTFLVSSQIIPSLGGDTTLWWKLSLGDHLRHPGRRRDSGTGEGVHFDELVARQGNRHLVAGRRRLAQHFVRIGGGELQRLLAGPGDALADVHRILDQQLRLGEPDGGAGGVRLRPGGLRIPGHGAGDHRGGLLRSGDRQRAVGLRAFHHRADSRHRRRDPEGFRVHARLRKGQGESGRKRRRGQYLQGDGQAGADRNRGGGRDHDDLFHHRGADQWAAAGAAIESVDSARALPVGTDHRRRDDLLVHRRIHPGGDHGRLSRGRVHQGQHQAGEAPPKPR